MATWPLATVPCLDASSRYTNRRPSGGQSIDGRCAHSPPRRGPPPQRVLAGFENVPFLGVRPLRWTGADRDFDRETMMMILELSRAQIAERRVQSAGVVGVDEPREVSADLLERLVSHQIDRLDFERLDEALGPGVVIRLAAPAHGADQAVFG